VVKVLLSLGADAGIANNEGITPQMLALQGGHSDILRVLRDHGSVVTATTMDTQLALLNSAAGDDQDMVKNLLSDGASPAATNSNGDTPLLLAVLAGNLDIVIALLDHGADPAATVQDGETALVAAASLGETDIIKAFLERGADPDTPNNLGVTPLAAAAREDHVEAARVLLEAGADALLLSSDGLQLKYSLTPFAIACGYGHDNVVQLLGDKGAYSKLSALDSLIPLHHGWRNHRDSGLERSSDKEHTVRSSQFAADDKDISEYSLKPWKYPAVMFLQTLANEAIPLAKKDFVGLEILGRILLLFNFPHLASIVFDQTMQFNTASQRATHNMRCNECYIDLSRKRYLCLDCGHVSLCGRCMMKGTTRREEKGQPFGCRGHEFFCIPSCERQPRYLDEEYSEEFVCFLQDLACSMVSIVEGKATLTNLEPSSPVNTPTG
ncbi:ankyrin repeat-containing domain protein, partial [Aspergillus stella-maris]|uniref:ankyrin repeat-containing domain protein n=1 Tax=Aspergillus stella-maris TaxID=1810926 RepID=UPI003CCD1F1F